MVASNKDKCWIEVRENSKIRFDYFLDYKKGDLVATIAPVLSLAYYGSVFCPSGDTMCSFGDYDLEVLKLKCLLKAKELGWDIKEVKV